MSSKNPATSPLAESKTATSTFPPAEPDLSDTDTDTDIDPDEPQEVFRCEWGRCDIKFTAANTLYKHIKVDHIDGSKDTSWICFWGICRNAHAQRAHLVNHMLTHVPYFPYFPFECDKCHKGFQRKSDFTRHSKRTKPCN
jgi:uncharacterized C2H2 Zn-finger protein